MTMVFPTSFSKVFSKNPSFLRANTVKGPLVDELPLAEESSHMTVW